MLWSILDEEQAGTNFVDFLTIRSFVRDLYDIACCFYRYGTCVPERWIIAVYG